MKPFTGKIGLIGAGAMGGYYGARLAKAGCDVHFLLRRDYEAVRRDGLRIESPLGDFVVRPPVYSSAEALGPCDLVVVGLKTTDNAALPALLASTVGPETRVLTLQNGLGNEDEIARVLADLGHRGAPARVLGGVAFICCNRGEPGTIIHQDHGWMRLAAYEGAINEDLTAVGALFREAGLRVELHDSLAEIRWLKLVWNVPFNGLGVAAERATSRMVLDDPALLVVARGLMEEVVASARADGVEIPSDYIGKMIAVTDSMGHYKSSMQIDYECGRPMEVESILGEPLHRARRAGIATPRLEFLYAVARRLDVQRRRFDPLTPGKNDST